MIRFKAMKLSAIVVESIRNKQPNMTENGTCKDKRNLSLIEIVFIDYFNALKLIK